MPRKSPTFVGFTAGAIAGAVLRFVVALAFLYYVSRWGGKWWSGSMDMWFAALISAAIGVGVGGLAGWTCRPILGALIGAVLSAGTCGAFFVIPTTFMIGMSHQDASDPSDPADLFVGLAAMTLAGALAGFIGGAIGRRAKRASAIAATPAVQVNAPQQEGVSR